MRGHLKRSARTVQLFGRLAVVETHTLWYFGHHCCLIVGFDALGLWHFWIFTLFHPFLPFCAHALLISTTPTLFLGWFLPTMGPPDGRGYVANHLWATPDPVSCTTRSGHLKKPPPPKDGGYLSEGDSIP